MLTRLIPADQVVLVCGTQDIHIFYDGKVYHWPNLISFEDLQEEQRWPIWALIDWDLKVVPPLKKEGTWPIQVSSPDSSRWRGWRKQHKSYLLGMDLWNMDELVSFASFSFSPQTLPVLVEFHR